MTHSKKIKFKINFTSLRKGRASGYFKNTVTMKKPEPALSRISDELKLKIISALGEIEAPGFIDLLEKLPISNNDIQFPCREIGNHKYYGRIFINSHCIKDVKLFQSQLQSLTAAESRRTFPIEIVGNMIEINIHDLRNNYTNQHTLAGHRSINTRGFFLATAHSDINRNDISAPTEIRPEMRMTFSAL